MVRCAGRGAHGKGPRTGAGGAVLLKKPSTDNCIGRQVTAPRDD